MAVERNVPAGTTVFTSTGKEGKVVRSYEGTSVVVVDFPGERLAMSRHELNRAPAGMSSGVGDAWANTLSWGNDG